MSTSQAPPPCSANPTSDGGECNKSSCSSDGSSSNNNNFVPTAIEGALLKAAAAPGSGIFVVPLFDVVPEPSPNSSTAVEPDNSLNGSVNTEPTRQIFVGQLPIFVQQDWVVPIANFLHKTKPDGTFDPSALLLHSPSRKGEDDDHEEPSPEDGAVSCVVRRSSGARASPYALVTLSGPDVVAAFRSLNRCAYVGRRHLFYCHPSTASQAPVLPALPPPTADEMTAAKPKPTVPATSSSDRTTTPLHELVSQLMETDAALPAPETRAHGLARACVVVGPANPPPPRPLAAADTHHAAGGHGRGGPSSTHHVTHRPLPAHMGQQHHQHHHGGATRQPPQYPQQFPNPHHQHQQRHQPGGFVPMQPASALPSYTQVAQPQPVFQYVLPQHQHQYGLQPQPQWVQTPPAQAVYFAPSPQPPQQQHFVQPSFANVQPQQPYMPPPPQQQQQQVMYVLMPDGTLAPYSGHQQQQQAFVQQQQQQQQQYTQHQGYPQGGFVPLDHH